MRVRFVCCRRTSWGFPAGAPSSCCGRGHRVGQAILDLDRIRNSDPEGLLADLTERTGLDIDRYSIDDIDLLRETARITIHYRR